MKKNLFIIGVDEVGRGPIAGPVAVGAFIILEPAVLRRQRIFAKVKESKQLSPIAREGWFTIIEKARKQGSVDFHVAFRSHAIIDRKGISWAIQSALDEAVEKVTASIKPDSCQVLLDGGLRASARFKNQKTIIRGDAKKTSIALASICAKVLRDRRMVRVAAKYPEYGFEIHKGYGTKAHRLAIKNGGLSDIHRLTFCKKLVT